MKVKVGPARRPGNETVIYDEPLSLSDIAPETDGTIRLSFDALGIRCDKSRYRYQMKLSRDDISRIIDAAKYGAGVVTVTAVEIAHGCATSTHLVA